MRALLWIIAALAAVLGLVGVTGQWPDFAGPQLGQPIRIAPKSVSTAQHGPEASNFRLLDRVFHSESATAQSLRRMDPNSR
jgi:hypothetical protein